MLTLNVIYFLLSTITALAGPIIKRSTTTIHVSGEGYASSPTLYGLMIEDISHSISGGLYGELLENRAFQIVPTGTSSASLNAWTSFGGCSISVVNNSTVSSLSSALPNSLAVNITAATGGFGVANSGYGGNSVVTGPHDFLADAQLFLGIGVTADKPYYASFYAKPINVALVSESSGVVFASATIVPAKGLSDEWQQFAVTLYPSSSASDTKNTLVVNFNDATGSQSKKVYMTLFSLFTSTYKDRPNGMRADIATVLKEMAPTFLRFPEGNNIEGQTIDTRWKWYDTVGPLVDRPGRSGDWGYINNDGFGLLEFLLACEDLELEPYMAVYAGYSLNGQSILESDFGFVVEDAVNQIQYAIGDSSTNIYAAQRAADGHPEPFKVSIIEIGNEDFFALSTYNNYRWNLIATGILKAFPNSGLQLMSTNGQASVSPETNKALIPAPSLVDAHNYDTPAWFVENQGHFDADVYPRTGQKIFFGEYAVTASNSACLFGALSCGRYAYAELIGSIAEGTFMTGLERNSDVVFSASYAPLIGAVYSHQWTPNLITITPDSIYKSTSYYVQQMFAANKGETILPSSPTTNDPFYYVVSQNSRTGVVYIKATNTQAEEFTFTMDFDNTISIGTSVLATTLTHGNSTLVSNTPTSPATPVPVTSSFTILGSTFEYTIPGFSVLVLAISHNVSVTIPISTTLPVALPI